MIGGRMRRMMGTGLVVVALAFVPAVASGQGEPAGRLAADSGGAVVLLVRHAETEANGTRDPSLSEEGLVRAARLSDLLAETRLDVVYTTDYTRTRGTAGAVADRLGLETRVYNPSRLEVFAQALRDGGGRILVVGHSNTTPELVAALGGDPGGAMTEEEHDRLYVLYIAEDGVRTVLFRY